MFTLFKHKASVTVASVAASTELPKGWLRPQSASALLALSRRRQLLDSIWQRTSVSQPQFDRLYRTPLERYAELVQLFPASESHHHAYSGGMLDHGLEIVAYALKLRQSRLLPIGVAPETQAAQAEAWTAGIAYAALLHDIGKIAVDLQVEYADGKLWHPWHGPLKYPYRFRYRKEREYALHNAAAGLLYSHVLTHEILDWLSGFPELWSLLLYALAGHHERAGALGDLITQADQASVAQELGGDPSKVLATPKHALQRKLLDGLRYLLNHELKLNQPQASDGWLTQEALWLVSKTVADKLRAHLLSQGMDGIPENNITLFNVLQDHDIVHATPEGKAIWKATVTSTNGWSHRFTFLKLTPALFWNADNSPAFFVGTVNVDVDETAPINAFASTAETRPIKHGLAESTAAPHTKEITTDFLNMPELNATRSTAMSSQKNAGDADQQNESESFATPSPPINVISDSGTIPSGLHFMEWLRTGIQSHRLIINDAKALVHTVADTVYLVSPGIFKRYAREHPQIHYLANQEHVADWAWVQKRFERLGVHKKHDNGLNIWACEVTGPRKSRRLHGYLLSEPTPLLSEIPFNNPFLQIMDDQWQGALSNPASSRY